MNRIKFIIAALIVGSGVAAADLEINTTLMHYTFRIEGPTGKPNEVTYGTGFIMGIPNPDSTGQGQMVLVTAAHVLGKISGETATINLRQKEEKRFTKVPWKLNIRKGGTPLWIQHPKADIAVMKVALPQFVSDQSKDIPTLSTDLFANDEMLEKFEIHRIKGIRNQTSWRLLCNEIHPNPTNTST